jgi:3-(3-hydroxy-phenyl)propionate hydroxylase
MTYKALYQYGYRRSRDQDAARPVRHPVVVIGAGPVGLAAAIDLAQRGHRIVLLDDNDKISEGSRAICFSKRALEVADTLGVGDRMVEKGVEWRVGKIFLADDLAYQFDLLPEPGYKRPAFVNLQQYYLEAFLVERAEALGTVDIRWRNNVIGLEQEAKGVGLSVETPDGPYTLEADWVVAADGARSAVREIMGLEFVGQVFNDRFLIADIKMTAPFPTERWFRFEPTFHPGQSVLLHKQPDEEWRVDFQLGPEADPREESRPERVAPRIRAMLGDAVPFEIGWVSVYTFQCKRMEHFRHGRVLFAGDAAHQVSPFGARGANSGLEDAHNLAWKLDAVLQGDANARLLDSYAFERELAADDNIGHSTRATDFISPKSQVARTFRNATLRLARHAPFAARMINSGRLSTPSHYAGSPLTTPDRDHFDGEARLGFPAPDAPLTDPQGRPLWLLDRLSSGFTALWMADGARPSDVPEGVRLLAVGKDLIDARGLFAKRYDATPGSAFLVRPDQYLCYRLRTWEPAGLAAARARALGDTTAPKHGASTWPT